MSLDVGNFASLDPFAKNADTSNKEGGGGSSSGNIIHIRNQQRNGRKSVTTIQGLEGYDLKKLVKYFKKSFSCNGTVIEDDEHGNIIQLQGDKRHDVKSFLEKESICTADQIRIHGA